MKSYKGHPKFFKPYNFKYLNKTFVVTLISTKQTHCQKFQSYSFGV